MADTIAETASFATQHANSLNAGWSDAIASFMKSGGYHVASKVAQIQQETLIVWGRNDQILDVKLAEQFKASIPRCTLAYIESCGHCGHVEKPEEAARLLLQFAAQGPEKERLERQGITSVV